MKTTPARVRRALRMAGIATVLGATAALTLMGAPAEAAVHVRAILHSTGI